VEDKRRGKSAPPNEPLKRPREEMPTLPFDLSQYAREATGEPRVDGSPESEAAAAAARHDVADFDPTRVPRLTVAQEDLVQLKLDHRAGFLVSLLDGVSTIEMIVDVAGMPQEEALSALQALYLRGIIRLA
jgi:hypothetical protein